MTLFHLISEPAGCCSTNTPWGPGRGGFLFDPTGTSSTFSRGLMSAKGSSRFDLPTSRENRFNYISRPDFWFCKATSSSNDTLLLTIFFLRVDDPPGGFRVLLYLFRSCSFLFHTVEVLHYYIKQAKL